MARICGGCGADIPASWSYCYNCGHGKPDEPKKDDDKKGGDRGKGGTGEIGSVGGGGFSPEGRRIQP